MNHHALQELIRSLFSICDRRASCSKTLGGISAKDRCAVLLSPLCVFAALQIIRHIEHPAIQGLNRSLFQFVIVAPAEKNALRNWAARCVQQPKHDAEAIFELRWSARIPQARPGGAGHDGKTSWCGTCRNGAAGSLRSQQSARKPALFATRSLAVYSRRNMMLKPSLSFAGPREYRWQGLEVPVMMGKRRGTAQIATASLGVCAPSNRHESLLFSTRSLAVYTRSNIPP